MQFDKDLLNWPVFVGLCACVDLKKISCKKVDPLLLLKANLSLSPLPFLSAYTQSLHKVNCKTQGFSTLLNDILLLMLVVGRAQILSLAITAVLKALNACLYKFLGQSLFWIDLNNLKSAPGGRLKKEREVLCLHTVYTPSPTPSQTSTKFFFRGKGKFDKYTAKKKRSSNIFWLSGLGKKEVYVWKRIIHQVRRERDSARICKSVKVT